MTLLGFLDSRIERLISHPRMWGSLESVEHQVLQLLTVRRLVVEPASTSEELQLITSEYARFVVRLDPGATTIERAVQGDEDEFTRSLSAFAAAQTEASTDDAG